MFHIAHVLVMPRWSGGGLVVWPVCFTVCTSVRPVNLWPPAWNTGAPDEKHTYTRHIAILPGVLARAHCMCDATGMRTGNASAGILLCACAYVRLSCQWFYHQRCRRPWPPLPTERMSNRVAKAEVQSDMDSGLEDLGKRGRERERLIHY